VKRLTLCLLAGLALASGSAAVEEEPSAVDIAKALNERPRPSQASRVAELTLIDAERKPRVRRLLLFWKLQPDSRWLALFALSPPEMKNTAFLAHDHFDTSRQDDQWYYWPERKRAQRIANPNRGESFLGSEFSFEDLKKEDRFEIGEFNWKKLGTEKLDGRNLVKLEQLPVTEELAKQLGYGRIVSWVDTDTLLRRRIEFFDPKGAALKTFEVRDVEQIDGFWTPRRIEATNHQTGHRSLLVFREIDYQSPVSDEIFSVRTLEAERAERLR